MLNNELNLFFSRRFLPLFITQSLGAFNDNAFKNAFVMLITYRLSDAVGLNSQLLITLAAGIFILPFFLFSATAGQLADKYEKSRLIIFIKFIEIIMMMVAAIAFYSQNIFLLLAILFALGTHSTFFGPVKYAIIPDQLDENELIAGNGLIEAGTFISILLGTLLGGMMILLPHGTALISAILLVAAVGGFSSSCLIPRTKNYQPHLKMNYRFIQETFSLMKYAKERSDLFLSILGISWFWLFGATFLSELAAFAKTILHANDKVVILFLTLFSIGLAIGSVLCNRLLKEKVKTTYVPLGALGMTLFTLDLYFAANGIVTLDGPLLNLTQFLTTIHGARISADLLLMAIFAGIYTVPLYTILQQNSDQTYRSRIIASNNVMNAFFMVIASLMTMLMLKFKFSIAQLFLFLSITNGLVAIYTFKLLPDLFIRQFFRCLLKLFYRVKIIGLENYPSLDDRVVIIANHTSFIDALLLAVFLPGKLTFAVNTHTAKKWWVKLFLRLVDAYPVDSANPMAIKSLIELAEQNKRLVVFPEGRLTTTGALMKIYEGPGLIADKSNAKLLPIYIHGAHLTPFSRLRGKVRTRLMPTITMTIFPAQQLAIDPEIKGRKRRQKVNNKLYDMMVNSAFAAMNYKKTLFQSLIDAAKAHGFRHKIIEDIEKVSINYRQVIQRAFILGRMLAKNTVPNECVGMLLPTMISNVLTFFGLQAFCRIPVILNYSTGIHPVVLSCQTAKINTVYTSRRFVQLAKLTEMINSLKEANIQIIYLEDLRSQVNFIDKLRGYVCSIFPYWSYQLLNRRHQYLLKSDHASVILFTSGSEGAPKGVVLSHQNILANRHQLGAVIDFTRQDKVFNALPLFHSFGLTAGTLLPLLSGVKVFLYPSPLHYRFVPELSYETNATILFGTDTFLAGYAKYAHPYDFYSLRYVFAGAEKLRNETRLIWSQKFNQRILEGYGATEASPVIAINTSLQNKVGTVGRLLPGMEYQIHSVAGIESGGELNILGPNIMKGYLLSNQPGELVSYEQKWYETGDIVNIDEEGFVTISGRRKRFAKVAGEMISLTMVEQLINKLWPHHQHAVVNIPDEKKGEQIILMTTYPGALRESLIEFYKTNQVGEIAIPKKIMIKSNLPLLGTGKIDYTSIKSIALQS